MINRIIFANLLDGMLKEYSNNFDKFESSLGVPIPDGWMVEPFDKIISSLTDACFAEEVFNSNFYLGSSDRMSCCTSPDAKKEWEAVNEVIYHYAFTSQFGKDPKQCERLLVRTNKDTNEETKVMSAKNASELWDVIQDWLNRDTNTDNYLLDTSWRTVDKN